MKYINFKRYKFSTIEKTLDRLRYNFLKIFKSIDFKRYGFRKISKYLDVRRFSVIRFIRYLDIRKYDVYRLKKIKIISSNFLLLHLPASIIFFGLLYLVIPTFYDYDKSNIEKQICKNKNIECLIRGKTTYSFYPTPRINIKDLIIKDFTQEKNTLIAVDHAAIKLSIKNLLAKDKHKYKKILLNNYEININLKNLKKYKNIFTKKSNLIPTTFKKGRIIFFDGKEYIASINNTNINLVFNENNIASKIKGEFLNDNLYFDLDSKKVGTELSTDIILKMSKVNFLTKANFIISEKNKNIINGNILIKSGKNRITGLFDYKDNKIIINKSNVKNTFLDGGLKGQIILLPYFNFNLDLDLNSINFTKLYNNFLALDKKQRVDLFKINNKINGKLNLSSDKIYSSYNLVKSLESRIQFSNGNIIVDQLLINLGKLGASDILGTINNDKKITSFKFESNIFVDNQKKFLSKFGIYNKKKISSNLFVSGNFDLDNLRAAFYEISGSKKLSNEDVNFIEKEFNNLMLEDDFDSLFLFPKFKEFIKSINEEN